MSWFAGEELEELGVKVMGKNSYGNCHRDSKLITGDGPKVANEFGKMCAEALLSELKPDE